MQFFFYDPCGGKGHGVKGLALLILLRSAQRCLMLCVLLFWSPKPQPHNEHLGSFRSDVAVAATFGYWLN